MKIKSLLKLPVKLLSLIHRELLIIKFRIIGPPRILTFNMDFNAKILRAFGARVGKNNVRILSPITLHEIDLNIRKGYRNLTISDGCVINGNNYLDLTSRITLEKGVSLGPNVTIMTHNYYNFNSFLEERLAHTCGKKEVLIKEGAGIKAGALVAMGVTIGRNAVVAGGAVVNRDIPDNCFVAGVPARLVKEIK